MFEMSIKFANLCENECSAENIQEIIKQFGCFMSLAGEKRGYDHDFYDSKGNLIVLTIELTHLDSKKANPDKTFLPGDPDHKRHLWQAILRIKEELAMWFDGFIENKVPFDKLKSLFLEINPSLVVLAEGKTPWQPQMGMTLGSGSLREFVLAREILLTFSRGKGEQFKRIRKCPECGKYFFAHDVRKTFCSPHCKGANFYRINKKRSRPSK